MEKFIDYLDEIKTMDYFDYNTANSFIQITNHYYYNNIYSLEHTYKQSKSISKQPVAMKNNGAKQPISTITTMRKCETLQVQNTNNTTCTSSMSMNSYDAIWDNNQNYYWNGSNYPQYNYLYPYYSYPYNYTSTCDIQNSQEHSYFTHYDYNYSNNISSHETQKNDQTIGDNYISKPMEYENKTTTELLPTNLLQENKSVSIKKLIIEEQINTIADILQIIKSYPIFDDIEYNIDLPLLQKIEPELTKINNMVGMTQIKQAVVDQLFYFMQKLHINSKCDYKHTVIYGPPGTGKTEIAKIIGTMYSKIGILNKNIFKKVTRNDLIAGYLGQTALKTKAVIEECLGGVLFIDEAYALGNKNGDDFYSTECIDILCEALSDHKDDLMVIIAGYEEELNDHFFPLNKGLKSRFIWQFKIENYSAKELREIFNIKIANEKWSFENTEIGSVEWFEKSKQYLKHFGRDIELLIFYIKISHSKRIFGKDPSLRKIINKDDLENGYKLFLENTKPKPNSSPMGLYI